MNARKYGRFFAVAALASVVLFAGCSSEPTSTPSEQTQDAPASPRGDRQGVPGVSGMIAEVDGTTMQVQSDSGQTAVTWTDETSFTEQVPGDLSDVEAGMCVFGMGAATDEEGTDSEDAVTVSQLTVTKAVDGKCQTMRGRRGGGSDGDDGERPSGAPSGMPSGAPGGESGERPEGEPGERPEGGPGERPSGAPEGGPDGQGRPGTMVSGTVSSVDGHKITVTDDEGAETTFTVADDVVVTTEKEASASDVAVDLCALAVGEPDSTGAVTATSVRLSEPADGSCGGGGFRR